LGVGTWTSAMSGLATNTVLAACGSRTNWARSTSIAIAELVRMGAAAALCATARGGAAASAITSHSRTGVARWGIGVLMGMR
jgi:hypothetical protein